VKPIFLGDYLTLEDSITIEDLAKAFETALAAEKARTRADESCTGRSDPDRAARAVLASKSEPQRAPRCSPRTRRVLLKKPSRPLRFALGS
jgi:hypothetical protein